MSQKLMWLCQYFEAVLKTNNRNIDALLGKVTFTKLKKLEKSSDFFDVLPNCNGY